MATEKRWALMLRVTATALIVLLSGPELLRAQTAAAFPVTGVVQDQTGGILQNAVVDLVRGSATEQSAGQLSFRFKF